jgi:hypothetical protein
VGPAGVSPAEHFQVLKERSARKINAALFYSRKLELRTAGLLQNHLVTGNF